MNDEINTNINIEPDYPRDANGNVAYPDTSPEEIARKKYKEDQERINNANKKKMQFGAFVIAIATMTGIGGYTLIKDTAKAVPEFIKTTQESNNPAHYFSKELDRYEIQENQGWNDVAAQVVGVNESGWDLGDVGRAISQLPENINYKDGVQKGNFVYFPKSITR